MRGQSLISRGFRADTIYIKLPMLNVFLLAMAFAIINEKRVGSRRGRAVFILILNSLVTRLYNNVLWVDGMELGRGEEKNIYTTYPIN